MKKHILFVLTASCTISSASYGMQTLQENMLAKVGATALMSATFIWGTNKISQTQFATDCCEKLNTSPIAVKQVLNLSAGLCALSLFTDKYGEAFRDFAWKAPLIGFVSVALNTKTAREIISSFPGIGSYLVCPMATKPQVEQLRQDYSDTSFEVCHGNCEHCEITKYIRVVAGWTIAKYAVPAGFYYLKNRFSSAR